MVIWLGHQRYFVFQRVNRKFIFKRFFNRESFSVLCYNDSNQDDMNRLLNKDLFDMGTIAGLSVLGYPKKPEYEILKENEKCRT